MFGAIVNVTGPDGDPVRTMHEMEGDMYMSDYRKLSEAQWKISSTLELLKKKYNDV